MIIMVFINFVIIIIFVPTFIVCVAIDNGIIGEPKIDCTETEIHFEVKTQKPFAGRIYAKGRVDDQKCVNSTYISDKTMNPVFDIPFGNCGVKGMKSLEPQGMFYVITLVVSFHPMFVTKVDKAFYVKCFFAESKFAVTANIGVSMIATTEAVGQRRADECFYSIHKGTLDEYDKTKTLGPPLQYAQVGDKIVHRWFCPDPMFGIFLHDCTVSDGLNETAAVIDNRGCPIDPILISAVRYSTNLTEALAESHVFKFADKPGVFFSCKIQQCMIMSGDCNNLTPPTCAMTATGVPVINTHVTQIEPIGQSSPLGTVPTPGPFTPSSLPISPPVVETTGPIVVTTGQPVVTTAPPLMPTGQPVVTTAPPLPPNPYGGGIHAETTLANATSIIIPTPHPGLSLLKADSVLSDKVNSSNRPSAAELLDKISLERQTYFWSLRHNDSVIMGDVTDDDIQVDTGQQLTGRLIIYDIDESPPNSNYRLPEEYSDSQDAAYLFTTTVANNSPLPRNADDWKKFGNFNSPQCAISSQALTMIVASFGSICGFLMLILLIMCLKFRQRTLNNQIYRQNNGVQQNSNNCRTENLHRRR